MGSLTSRGRCRAALRSRISRQPPSSRALMTIEVDDSMASQNCYLNGTRILGYTASQRGSCGHRLTFSIATILLCTPLLFNSRMVSDSVSLSA